MLYWPLAAGNNRVIVSRLLYMSMKFESRRWGTTSRFHARLHVHHQDPNHFNCLLENLSVVDGAEHVAEHNRLRRRR